jgi:hypothetical protein
MTAVLPCSRHRRASDIHHADLMREIQRVGRFVEQQQRRVLRQHGGNRHALAFAAGQGAHVARCQVGHFHRFQRFDGDGVIVAVFPVAVIVIGWRADSTVSITL